MSTTTEHSTQGAPMRRVVHISATFAVEASTAADGEIDIAGLSPDEIAERVEQLHPGISLCHECGREVSDPEISEMTGFTVDGTEYMKADGHWKVTGDAPSRR